MPRVSVIIPNYNHETYLKQRIDSVLNQDFQDFSIIILDDRSIDNSSSIIESYRDHPKIEHIVYNEQNSGTTFKQWNKGFALASGEFIWIAESDDVADVKFLEVCVNILDVHSNVALVSSNAKIIDMEGSVIHDGYQNDVYQFDEEYKIFDGNKFIKEKLNKYNYISNASGVLFRKDRIKNAGKEYLSYKINGDWIFWINLIIDSELALVSKRLNYFRTHQSSVRSKIKKKLAIKEVLKINDKIADLGYAKKNDLQLQNYKYFIIYKHDSFMNYEKLIEMYNDGQFLFSRKIWFELQYIKYIYHPTRKIFFFFKGLLSKFSL